MSERQSGDAHPVSIGVVIVNWRNAADTLLCLESLATASPRPARVVVIDNGSGDGSFDELTRWAVRQPFSFDLVDAGTGSGPRTDTRNWLSIVRGETNRGFAGGNNIGLALLERDPRL